MQGVDGRARHCGATVALSHQPLTPPLLAQYGGLAYLAGYASTSSASFSGCTITSCSATADFAVVRACSAPRRNAPSRPRAA